MPFDFNPPPVFASPFVPPPSAPRRDASERGRWDFLLSVAKYGEDVDGYRSRYGKAEGEARFFAERRPFETCERRGNMLLIGGASLIWECLMGNGTTTSGQSTTFFSGSNGRIAVGDGGPASGTGTVSVTNGSTTFTFSGSQTFTVGDYITVATDSSGGVYRIASGSGTSWTMETGYGGTTASGLSFAKIAGEVDTQTDLQATTNKVRQALDATFPYHLTSGGDSAITGATNATPIVVTCTNSYSNGDFVSISGVRGNTAANGLWQIDDVSGTAFTLNNSVGNGAYTSGGVASKRKVMVAQATFGTGAANFTWNEWGLANAATGGTLINRKVAGLGSKTSSASWAFKAAVALS